MALSEQLGKVNYQVLVQNLWKKNGFILFFCFVLLKLSSLSLSQTITLSSFCALRQTKRPKLPTKTVSGSCGIFLVWGTIVEQENYRM